MPKNLNKLIQDKLEMAIVKIATTSGQKGTGFFINFEGHVLTAWHCIEEVVRFAFSELVVIYDGHEIPAEVDKDKSLPDEDIAILKVKGDVPLCLPLGLVDVNHRSDPIVSIGYPAHELNSSLGRYPGSISRLDGNKIEVAGAIQGKGQSGGLIYHYESKRVVGLVIELIQSSIMRNAGLAARFDSLFHHWPELQQMTVGVAATWKEQLKLLEEEQRVMPLVESEKAPENHFLKSLDAIFIWIKRRLLTDKAADEQRNLSILRNGVQRIWVDEQLEGYALHLQQRPLIVLQKQTQPELVKRPQDAFLPKPEQANFSGKPILEVFETRKFLLISGEPGSGKTVTLLELARDLMAIAFDQQDTSQPIPVIFNLSSWTETKKLFDWLVAQFALLYKIRGKFSSAWLKQRNILLLLDGLDEVNVDYRASCVKAINAFVQKYQPLGLVVCCRRQEYVELPLRLQLEGSICLQPLTEMQISGYLELANLSSLQILIAQDDNLQELAKNPLLLDLMSFAYQDVTVEEIKRAEAETFETLWQQLFDRYIDNMFERKVKQGIKQKTLDKLTWLASKMQQQEKYEFFIIEDIRPSYLGSKKHEVFFKVLFGIGMAALLGLLFFRIAQRTHFFLLVHELWLRVGTIGMAYYVFILSIEHSVPEAIHWSWKGAIKWAVLLSLFGILGGIYFIDSYSSIDNTFDVTFDVGTIGKWLSVLLGIDDKILLILGAMLIGGWLGFFWGGIIQGQLPSDLKITPNQGIHHAIKNILQVILPFSVGFGIYLTINYSLYDGLATGMGALLGGGIIFGGLVPIIQHYYVRFLLFANQGLPLNIVTLLNQATQLFLQRRVGGGYKFIHRLVLEHVANKFDPAKEQQAVKKITTLFLSSLLVIMFISVFSVNLLFKGVISFNHEYLYEWGQIYYKNGDYEIAFQNLSLLAEEGYADAQNDLGDMYQKGLGVPQDYAMAEQWYQQSAEQGNVRGHRNLCRLYIIQEKFEAANKISCPRIEDLLK
jgi:hypothetical protein